MGRKAKHHYIPKCYLKRFTEGGENSSKFFAIDMSNGSTFQTTPNDACAQRDYYTVNHYDSLIVENFYAEQIEPKIVKAIEYISDYSQLPPKKEMSNLILLLSTLYLRTPAFRDSIEMPMRRTREIVEGISEEISISNREEFYYTKTDLIKSELKHIDTVQECLSHKYYQLYVIEDHDLNVITSDKPFVLSHPRAGSDFYYGLNTENIEICIPITRKAILIGKNEPIDEGTFIAPKELIGLANYKISRAANRFFYSAGSDVVLIDEDLGAYGYNVETKQYKNI